MKNLKIIPVDQLIYTIRGHRVMLDRDLARVYGVSTARLNQQANRNKDRFPDDFRFQLTAKEGEQMRLRFATASKRNVCYRPYAFTEHGVVAAAFVLNSPVAVSASIQIVRSGAPLSTRIWPSPSRNLRAGSPAITTNSTWTSTPSRN